MRRALLVLSVALASAAPAGASTIVYECDVDICSLDPGDGQRRQVTTDGFGGVAYYERPQLTPDGRTLVFEIASRTWVADRTARRRRAIRRPRPAYNAKLARLSPSGRRILFLHGYDAANFSSYDPCVVSVRRGARPRCRRVRRPDCGIEGWADERGFLSSRGTVIRRSGLSGECGRVLARAPRDEVFDFRDVPVVTRDGRFLAARLESGRIALFATRSARFIRMLTSARHRADQPAWSPDGRRLVFRRDAVVQGSVDVADICVVRRNGRSERCLLFDAPYAERPHWGG